MKIGTVALITNGEGEILLVQRPNDHKRYPGQWVMPGGKLNWLDPGYWESPEECNCREVREETGIILRTFSKLNLMVADDTHLAHCFESNIAHSDDEITVKFPNKEHQTYEWFDVNDLPDTVSEMVYSVLDFVENKSMLELNAFQGFEVPDIEEDITPHEEMRKLNIKEPPSWI